MSRLIFLAVVAGLSSIATSGAPGRSELEAVLSDALWREGPDAVRKPLTLKFRREGEMWTALVMGHSRTYNWGDHHGVLTSARREGATLKLAVTMRIQTDPWSSTDTVGQYDVTLSEAGGQWTGSWSGTVRGEPGKGAATASEYAGMTGFAPPAPGEYPRLLLRKSQIPALREKARTEWGLKMLDRLKAADTSKSSAAVGRALLYILTGEKKYAEEAESLLRTDVENGRWQWSSGIYHDPAVMAVEALIAHDLIRDACDARLTKRIDELCDEHLDYYYRGADNPLFNPNDGSNWSAMFRSGVGLCALALHGRKSELLRPLAMPELVQIKPPADLKIGNGVPVVKLKSGRHWSQWLFAGPVKVTPRVDALASLGGAAEARPEEGTAVASEPPVTFAPLDPKALISAERAVLIRQPAWEGGVDLTVATKRGGPATCYLYAVMDVEQAGWYRIELLDKKMIEPTVLIAGRRLANKDYAQLEKGRYPVLAWLPITRSHTQTNIEFFLRLHAVGEDEAQRSLARARQAYEVDLALWKEATERQQRDGLANPHVERWLGIARQRIENWAVRALGDIGWNHEGEAYTQHSYRVVLPFAHAYRNVSGFELASPGQLNRCLLNYVGRTVVGSQAGRMEAFAPGGGPLGVDNWARGFGLLTPEYRPYGLWTWNRIQSVADAGKLKQPEAPIDQLDPMSAAFMFVNYPLDVKEANPAEKRDLICYDRKRGGYVFRNRWQDDDDIAATVFLNSNMVGGGWSSAEQGEFRISGLGADWAVRGMGYGNGSSYRQVPNMREATNVLLPAEPVGQGPLEAVATHFAAQAEGSGVLSFSLDKVYAAAKVTDAEAPASQPAARKRDSGIRGMRSFAADYSGACGSPALFALADRITGSSGRNIWQLVTEKQHRVSINGRTFTITARNGATLKGTVAAPAAAKIDTTDVKLRHEINYHGGHKRADFERTVVRIAPAEGDKADFFLIVMTLQNGPAPQVSVAGEGAAAKAKAGRNAVTFDGTKVVVERLP